MKLVLNERQLSISTLRYAKEIIDKFINNNPSLDQLLSGYTDATLIVDPVYELYDFRVSNGEIESLSDELQKYYRGLVYANKGYEKLIIDPLAKLTGIDIQDITIDKSDYKIYVELGDIHSSDINKLIQLFMNTLGYLLFFSDIQAEVEKGIINCDIILQRKLSINQSGYVNFYRV